MGSYELEFSQVASGSGIADDSTATFTVGADSSLTLPSGKVLTNPVFYRGNKAELIWIGVVIEGLQQAGNVNHDGVVYVS